MILITEFDIVLGFLYGIKYNHSQNKKDIDSPLWEPEGCEGPEAPTLAQYRCETNRVVRSCLAVYPYSHIR